MNPMKDTPPQVTPNTNFFVYIIESPSAPDLYHKRYEGEALTKMLSLADIYSVHRLVVDSTAFRASIIIGLSEAMKSSSLIPMLHISAHGNSDGLQLTNGESISWDDLKLLIQPINDILNGNLVLCVSSCEGFGACRMAMDKGDKIPFLCLIASTEKISWADTAIGFGTFYHLIAKGRTIRDAVTAMKVATCDNSFQEIAGEKIKQIFINELKKSETQEMADKLSQLQPQPPKSLAELLRQPHITK